MQFVIYIYMHLQILRAFSCLRLKYRLVFKRFCLILIKILINHQPPTTVTYNNFLTNLEKKKISKRAFWLG